MSKTEITTSTQIAIRDLIKRTDVAKPSKEDLLALRNHLDSDATLVRANEITEVAYKAIIESHTNTALQIEICKRDIEDKRAEMGYHSASLLVKMLIDQVIICHLRLQVYEASHAKGMAESASIEVAEYRDRLLTNYQRRFLRATETLARVRRMSLIPERIQTFNSQA